MTAALAFSCRSAGMIPHASVLLCDCDAAQANTMPGKPLENMLLGDAPEEFGPVFRLSMARLMNRSALFGANISQLAAALHRPSSHARRAAGLYSALESNSHGR